MVDRIVWLGYKRPLVFDDMPDLLTRDKCQTLLPRFYSHWTKEVEACRKQQSVHVVHLVMYM